METYTYDPRPIWLAKEHYSYIIRSVKAIVTRQMLRLDHSVQIDLMVPSDKSDAKLSFETPVGGLCSPSGRNVYLLDDLPPLFLTRAVAHELKHAQEAQHLIIGSSRASRERSAQIFELELMQKLGWPTERNLIRTLASACDAIRDEEQSKIDKRREFVREQQRILANLKIQRGSSKTQMANLAQSISERHEEITKLEAQLARL
jgi:hypothetical protein